MADLLIRGMKLPKNLYGAHIIIKPNGVVQDYMNGAVFAKAIELPEHGRLIDADELEASDAILIGEDAWNMVHNAPTVLEANYGSDN